MQLEGADTRKPWRFSGRNLLGNEGIWRKEPAHNHRTPCPGVVEKMRAFYAAFEPDKLDIREDVNNLGSDQAVTSHSNVLTLSSRY